MNIKMERECSDRGVPEADIEELRKFSDFLAKRRAYREAKEAGTLTEEMKREYVDLINGFSK